MTPTTTDATLADFAEDAWPCPAQFHSSYREACERGRARMAGARVVICGLARDVSATLPSTVARIERTGAMFADFRVIIFENDSRDDTLAQLQSWQAGDERIAIVAESLNHPRWGSVSSLDRARQLATYRNRCRLLALDLVPHFEFVVVVDSDLLGWSYDGLANTFGHDDWDVVGANGISRRRGKHVCYDGWALRELESDRAVGDPSRIGWRVFPRGTPPLPVASCFGGLAVYRMAVMSAAAYDGSDCEHVALHQAARHAGFGRIFLNPSMIVLYPET